MKYFIYTLFFLCSMSSFSQEKTGCGPMFNHEMFEAFEERNTSRKTFVETSVNRSAKTTSATAENNVSVFKVKIHFIRDNNRNIRDYEGKITYDYDEKDVINSIQEANEVFEEFNISFDYCDSDTGLINYIDDNEYSNNPITTKSQGYFISEGISGTATAQKEAALGVHEYSLEAKLTDTHKEENTINIFYVSRILNTDFTAQAKAAAKAAAIEAGKTEIEAEAEVEAAAAAGSYNVYPGGYSYIPLNFFGRYVGIEANKFNYILMDYRAFGTTTLIHEFGHYFGLWHTFENGSLSGGVEICDSCETTGDRICDTPPEYSIYSYTEDGITYDAVIENDDCTYTNDISIAIKAGANIRINDGCNYDDNTHAANNYMSYFDFHCLNTFTDGQIAEMKRNAARYVARNEFSLDCIDCQLELEVVDNVTSGSVDEKSASSFIEASNTVFNGATAGYHAGEEVLLTDGFVAESGSSFDGYIEGCDILTSSKSVNLSNFSDTQELLSSNEETLDVSLKVYPNPSDGIFNVQSTNNIVSYAVKDLIGKQIATGKTDGNEFTVDITNFASGFYVLELQKENGEITRKKIIKN